MASHAAAVVQKLTCCLCKMSDTTTTKDLVILGCGHVLCFGCNQTLYNRKKVDGALREIAGTHDTSCPWCKKPSITDLSPKRALMPRPLLIKLAATEGVTYDLRLYTDVFPVHQVGDEGKKEEGKSNNNNAT